MHLGPPAQLTHIHAYPHTHTRTQSNLVGCQLHHARLTLELRLTWGALQGTRLVGQVTELRCGRLPSGMICSLFWYLVEFERLQTGCDACGMWHVACGGCTITGCRGRSEQQSKMNWLSTFNLIERLRQRTLACQAHALSPD